MKKLEKIYGLRMPMVRRWLDSKFRIFGINRWFQDEISRISEVESVRLKNIFGDYLGIPIDRISLGVHSLLSAPPHDDRTDYWYAKAYFYVVCAPCGSYIEDVKGRRLYLEANGLYEFNHFIEHWVCNEGSAVELLTISHLRRPI